MAEKVEPGMVFEGKVLRVKAFGVIVSLPENKQGLVHISHISSSYVQNIADYVAAGDTVKVKVLSVEPETGRISLSMKDAQPEVKGPDTRPNPVMSFEDKVKEWQKVSNERQAGLNKRNKRR
jgi:predicted RNA-binding protein with RPS1 domain